MTDTEEIQLSLRCGGKIAGKETENICKRIQQFSWQASSIVLLCGVSGLLILTLESQHRNNQLQVESKELKQFLNYTYQNLTLLRNECGQLKLLINATQYNFTLLSAEKTQLSLLLKNMSQEKAQLQVENKGLNMFLNSTLKNCDLVEKENKRLILRLNESFQINALASAESKQLDLLLKTEQQTSMQLKAENKHQRSILFSDNLSFLWRFCKKDTLQCSRCLPGWVEHAKRCFFMSQESQKWEKARRNCLDIGGDLAIVLNEEDQAFLTNLTFMVRQQYPAGNFHSAWIGLQDMVKEGAYIWVNGNRMHRDVIYWMPQEPNNAMASWDVSKAGQDCVAIVPPRSIGEENWLNSWDDIVCGGKRHYLCETMALGLS